MLHKAAAKTALAATAALSALLIPAAGSASAASHASGATVTARADSYDATCRSHSRTYVLKKYYRRVPVGPPTFYTLRCGTMDRKINAAIGYGSPNGRGGYYT